MDKHVRRLLGTVLALVVFLFVGRVVLGSLFDDASAVRGATVAWSKLGSSGSASVRPEPAAVSAVQAVRSSLRAQLADAIAELEYVQPEEFSVPEGASADLRFIDVLRREQDALVAGARYEGKSVPNDLGMPVPNPSGLEEVREALRALHVVDRVVRSALAAGISSVDSIRIPTAARRRARSGSLLRTHPVEFELQGNPRSVRDTLRALAAGSPYLALDDVRIESQDEDGELLRCRMSVAPVTFERERLAELEVLD